MNTSLNIREKRFIAVVAAIALVFGFTPVANAMHIMEGYLPVGFCIAWGVICIPFLIAGYMSMKKTLKENPKTITLLAMAGAYVFVLSSLKIPSVTGSCSHMTGTGLGAILFGPAPISILGLIVLVFQSTLLAHGGVTTLGANTFSMAVAGPFAAYGIYKLGLKLKINKHVVVFLAAALGDFFTYLITSFQLALAYPSEAGGVAASSIKFLAVFAPTQIPLAIIEGILTVVIIIGLETYAQPELNDLGYLTGGVR
ncbi:energy-coupling factor ABC transporter permease [Acetobacterium sp.]|uniref:energy-coupling factor ABC transporter permease n=1 Tax=Acetobacterium sp. TaxID=1872094 RepID=UPI000CC3858C|nr:energy-coupling factor ABC transporter permease [Acetobacterium sp.]MDO9492135.1 energy-coupling factor ABC transporter permease [Acetobacterium sp.]PKM74720.1 MAG: cobalamin biosynthesis protein CbiM [Firmicutes bacterium HGW-Firmicutes-17]